MKNSYNKWKLDTYSYNIFMKFANTLGETIEFDLIS